MSRWARASSCFGVLPGAISSETRRRVRASILPEARIFSISSGLLRWITGMCLPLETIADLEEANGQSEIRNPKSEISFASLHDRLVHALRIALGVDAQKTRAAIVKVDHGRGALAECL